MKRMQCVQDDEERKINRKTANFAANKVRGFSPCLNEEPYMEVEQGVQTCRLQFPTSILHSWLPSLFSWLPPFDTSSIAKYLKAVSRNLNKFLLLPTILELPLHTLSSPAPILPGVSLQLSAITAVNCTHIRSCVQQKSGKFFLFIFRKTFFAINWDEWLTFRITLVSSSLC